jgi:hypothetical protein
MLGLATALLFVVLGVVLAGAARAPSVHAATAPTVYNDPAGDAKSGAPDITSIVISDTGGAVTVAMTATGLVPGTSAAVWFDTDQNPSTGDPMDGTDYAVQVDNVAGTGIQPWFLKWDGSDWVELTPTPPMTYSAQGDTYTFTFSSADFGGTTAFDFYGWSWVVGSAGDDFIPDVGQPMLTYAVTSVEPPVTPPVTPSVEPTPPTGASPAASAEEPRPIMELPDGARYLFADGEYHQISPAQFSTFGLSVHAIYHVGELYEPVGAPATDEQVAAMKADYLKALNAMGVDTTPVKVEPAPAAVPEKPVISKPVTIPAKATAGKVFSVSFPVTSSVTGAKLVSATMIGNPSVKGTIIRHFEQFKNGNATIRLTIPATAKGKTLKVHLKMVLGEQSTIRIATFLVH